MRTKSPKSGQDKIYDMITNAILSRLEGGEIPWRKPWKTIPGADGSAYPVNLVSKKAYRGINVILLGMQGYQSPFWVTYKQAAQLGGNVRKGEKGTAIVFWKWFDRKEKNPTTGEKEVTGRYAMLRYYTVFNVEQTEGLEAKIPAPVKVEETEEAAELRRIEACHAVWDNYSARPEIAHRGNRAFYSPKTDYIQLPQRAQFGSLEEYYSTLFHEAVHSTGHATRINREGVAGFNGFGTEKYSKEELVAEFGAAFLCGLTDISPAVIDNQAAYIKGWSKKIKEDRTLIIKAAGAAQKAADWILDPATHFAE